MWSKYILVLVLLSLIGEILCGCDNKNDISENIDQKINNENELKENEELLENAEPTGYDKEALYLKAESLTKHIVERALSLEHINSNEQITLNDRDIFNFVITLFIYREDSNHPYSNIIEMHSDGSTFAHYDYDAVKKAVKELFGIENWYYALDKFYDKESNKIILCIEQGMPGGFLVCDDIEVNCIADTNLIESKFNITELMLYEDKADIDHEMYKIIFEVIQENENTFLRVNSIEKVK